MEPFTIAGVAIVSFGVGIMSGISIRRRAEEKQAGCQYDLETGGKKAGGF